MGNSIFYGIQLDEPSGHSNGKFEDVQLWDAEEKYAAFLNARDYDVTFSKKKKESLAVPKLKKEKSAKKKVKKKSDDTLKPVKKTRAKSYESRVAEEKKPKKKKKAVKYATDDVKVEEIKNVKK